MVSTHIFGTALKVRKPLKHFETLWITKRIKHVIIELRRIGSAQNWGEKKAPAKDPQARISYFSSLMF